MEKQKFVNEEEITEFHKLVKENFAAIDHTHAAGSVTVEVSDVVTEGDMRPITSNAVYVEMGNINALLQTI